MLDIQMLSNNGKIDKKIEETQDVAGQKLEKEKPQIKNFNLKQEIFFISISFLFVIICLFLCYFFVNKFIKINDDSFKTSKTKIIERIKLIFILSILADIIFFCFFLISIFSFNIFDHYKYENLSKIANGLKEFNKSIAQVVFIILIYCFVFLVLGIFIKELFSVLMDTRINTLYKKGDLKVEQKYIVNKKLNGKSITEIEKTIEQINNEKLNQLKQLEQQQNNPGYKQQVMKKYQKAINYKVNSAKHYENLNENYQKQLKENENNELNIKQKELEIKAKQKQIQEECMNQLYLEN